MKNVVKRLRMVLPVCLCIFFVLNPASNCFGKDKPITLKLNNPWPPTHHLAQLVVEPWAKIVEQRTNGRLKIQGFHGGSLSKARDVWEGTVGGMWDYGLWVPTYKYDMFMKTLINELPFVFPDNRVATKVIQKFVNKYAKDEFKDVKLATFFATDLYGLWSTKKVTKMDDFKGMKLRVSGRGWKHVMKAWGATAVSLGPGDMYMGLERGTIDGCIYSMTGGYGWRLQEVCPYIVKLDAQLIVGAVILNKRSWNKLPKDIQKILDEELHYELEKLCEKDYGDLSEKYWAEFEKQGKMILPSDKMKKQLRESALPVWDVWIKKADAKGYPGREMMNDFKMMLKAEGIQID